MTTRRAAILTALGLGAAMTTTDDLTSLFTARPAGPAQPVSYRQGVLTQWNPTNLQNQVSVGGTLMQDLPVLGVAEAASFKPGVVVGVITAGSTWAIIGRFVIPNTPDALDAITQIGQRAFTFTVLTAEDTNSSSFTNLATLGPQAPNILIPASGKAEVTISATIDSATSSPPFGAVGVEVSGATSIAPDLHKSLLIGNAALEGTRVVQFTGLPAGGLCTFTLKYLAGGGITARFSDRDITVRTL